MLDATRAKDVKVARDISPQNNTHAVVQDRSSEEEDLAICTRPHNISYCTCTADHSPTYAASSEAAKAGMGGRVIASGTTPMCSA